MTVVLIGTYISGLNGHQPAGGYLVCTQWQGRHPARRLIGDELVVAGQNTVRVVASEPVEPVDLEPDDGTFCWRIRVHIPARRFTETRYVSVPVSGPVAYEDLVDVDPATYVPTVDVVAAWEAAASAFRLTEDPPGSGLFTFPG